MRLILDRASKSNKNGYFRLANGKLYAEPKRKKTGFAAAVGTEFVSKEIKILRNKDILVFGFPSTCYQVFVGE